MEKAESSNNGKSLTADVATIDPSEKNILGECFSDPYVIADLEEVHLDVDPVATVMFMNHDEKKNHPDILSAEVVTLVA